LVESPPLEFKVGRWLTIDPGDYTAVCQWYGGIQVSCTTYTHCLEKVPDIAAGLMQNVIIENVELWSGSSISYASASSGDLFKLAFEIGALIYMFRQNNFPVYLVSPRKWKGQLNYKQLQYILKTKFSIETINDHEASAIGIGLWAKGIF